MHGPNVPSCGTPGCVQALLGAAHIAHRVESRARDGKGRGGGTRSSRGGEMAGGKHREGYGEHTALRGAQQSCTTGDITRATPGVSSGDKQSPTLPQHCTPMAEKLSVLKNHVCR